MTPNARVAMWKVADPDEAVAAWLGSQTQDFALRYIEKHEAACFCMRCLGRRASLDHEVTHWRGCECGRCAFVWRQLQDKYSEIDENYREIIEDML